MDTKLSYSLLAQYLKGETNGDDSRLVETWLASSEKNKAFFEELKSIWKTESFIEVNSEIRKSKVWGNIESQIKLIPEENISRKKIWLNYRVAAAASIVLLIVASIFFLFPKKNVGQSLAELQVIKNGSNNAMIVTLPDSSHVWLHKEASITFPKNANQFNRSVKLFGEAYFEISHDAANPFKVFSGAGIVKVLGTSFNIRPSGNGTTAIDVFTGTVKCYFSNDPLKQITLRGGERGIMDTLNNTLERDSLCDPNAMAWKTGIIKFKNCSLQKVCLSLSAYFDTNIACSSDVCNKTLSVQFNHPRITDALKVIEITLDVQVKSENKGLLFTETQ